MQLSTKPGALDILASALGLAFVEVDGPVDLTGAAELALTLKAVAVPTAAVG